MTENNEEILNNDRAVQNKKIFNFILTFHFLGNKYETFVYILYVGQMLLKM